jgi:hypothetical protein
LLAIPTNPDGLVRYRLAPSLLTHDQCWTPAVSLRNLNHNVWGRKEGRTETTLIEKTVERTDAEDLSARSDETPSGDVPVPRLVPGPESEAANDRRERRSRRASAAAEPLDFDARRQRRLRRVSSTPEPRAAPPATPASADLAGASTTSETQPTAREVPLTASGERRHRPRAPRAEQRAAGDAAATSNEAGLIDDATGHPDASAVAAEAPGIGLSVKRTTRTLLRAQRKQQQAAAAVENADDHPALGALNRHLNLLTQQLGTAHRVIGRVAAERDALRQQLADLQGIPIEAIVVTSVGAATEDRDERPARTPEPGEPQPQTGIARFNYFRHDDIAVMRKRRQLFALVLLGIMLGIWLLGTMGFLQMPENLGKDSLTHLPLIGNLMSVFLAGWIFYRVVKIGGKGVKWVFPNEPRQRRRR